MTAAEIKFDEKIYPHGASQCILWADEPTLDRIRFLLGQDVLKALGGVHPIESRENVALCDRERTRVEDACRRAFAERPATVVAVQARHVRYAPG